MSCAIDSGRFLLGQAYVEHAFSAEGKTIVVCLPPSAAGGGRTKEPATVLSRFPKKKAINSKPAAK
jgi:hypothetical protein